MVGRDFAGLVAVILATGVMIAFIIIALGAVITNSPLSTEEQTLLSTIVGAALGAVATYIGIARDPGSPPAEPPATPPDEAGHSPS